MSQYLRLDLNRLHDVLSGKLHGRGCGKTTAMLVQALGTVDFQQYQRIYIVVSTLHHAAWMADYLCRLAFEMGFKYIKQIDSTHVRVNRTLIQFLSRAQVEADALRWKGWPVNNPPKVFYDHYQGFPE